MSGVMAVLWRLIRILSGIWSRFGVLQRWLIPRVMKGSFFSGEFAENARGDSRLTRQRRRVGYGELGKAWFLVYIDRGLLGVDWGPREQTKIWEGELVLEGNIWLP
jgi:hypothetical protein